MSSSNCCFLTCIQVSQEASQVVWYSHLFQNFPQFIVIHTVKGFGIVNKAEIDVFLELSCFFNDPADVGNLISGSSAFSKTSLNIRKFMIHVLQAHNKVTRSPFVLLGKSQMKQQSENQIFQLHLGRQNLWQPVIADSNDNDLLSQVFLPSWIIAPQASTYRNEGQYKVHLCCPQAIMCVRVCVRACSVTWVVSSSLWPHGL